MEAYRTVLEKNGIAYRPEWNISARPNNGVSSYERVREFWEAGNRPDAIMAANGQSASGVMRYLYQQGVRIPDDLSIIAYEDSSMCGYATPALTAVNIRKEELGSRAAKCLIERIQNPDKEREVVTLKPFLVRRDSVRQR